ncbi:tRNA (guanosine(37)-N1)-methyltransferase TrmD [Megalodesulfovibrio paquesii]
MHFTCITLFPEFFTSPMACALMGKGVEKGLISFATVNPREFVTGNYKAVDDRPYGGGPGMVMQLDPLCQAIDSIPNPGPIVLLSPRGKPFTQAMARELAAQPSLTILCGRYEGVDARLGALHPIVEVSLGDYVLNGGEAAALCLMEAVARLTPGFMGKDESGEEESFSHGLLEYPHYTRPEDYAGQRVPEVLLGGDHGAVSLWRRQESLRTTLERRPDLLASAALTATDYEYLRSLEQTPSRRKLGRNLHILHVHSPVRLKEGRTGTASLTTFDIHDIGRVSCCYGVADVTVITPLEDQQELAHRVLGHWTIGAGGRVNAHRAQALSRVRVAASLEAALRMVEEAAGRPPRVLATSALAEAPRRYRKMWPVLVSFDEARRWLEEAPVCLLLGAGHGLAPEAMCAAQGMLPPVRPLDAYNHLPVRAAATAVLDRLLQDVW